MTRFRILNNTPVKFTAVLILSICLTTITAKGQTLHKYDHLKLDSIKVSNHKFINNIFQQAVRSIEKSSGSDSTPELTINAKSEKQYLRYQGKIIRHIIIERLSFENSFTDSNSQTVFSRIANATHTNTQAHIVRNNLFIKENTQLDPYKIADNERYLRTLDYIHDARIVVVPIRHNRDSVDIKVMTKDFFSLSASGSSDALNHVKMSVVDANIDGSGQRGEISGLYDYNRTPNFGYGLLYRNNSLGNTFINATASYSQVGINGDTHEEETATAINFQRPLVSPYAHFAGGLLLSKNSAVNLYNAPDSEFYKYSYQLFDGWIGYNIGANKLQDINKLRNRTFISARYFNYQFKDVPYQVGNNFNPVYNTRQGILGQITFFRQEYYKTQYIYGFGTTEDLPYGYNISLTGGLVKQISINRPYAGISASRYIATDKGDFVQLFIRTGGYQYNNQLQDAAILLGGTAFSRIFFMGETKIRQYISASYTHLYNRVALSPLRIDNSFGVRGFNSDSAEGDKRLTLQTETEFYLKYKLAGFKFAPFLYADCSMLTPENAKLSASVLYPALGGGIRTRNENLVFETIELRIYYYPRTIDDMHGFKIVISSNIKFRYNSNYVTAPDFVHLNQDQ